MIKKIFLVFSLLTCTFLPAMDKYKNIKPDSLALKLLIVAKALECYPETIDWCGKLLVNPKEINYSGSSITESSEVYTAQLSSGNKVFCIYFPTGQYAGQIWASIDRLASYAHALPIPQQNFFILKSHHEEQRNQ